MDIFSLLPSGRIQVPCPQPLLFGPVGEISKASIPDFHPQGPWGTLALQRAFFHSVSDKGVGGAVNGWDVPLTFVFTEEGRVGWLPGKPLLFRVTASSGHPLYSPVLVLQPHLHSYKEAFEEMEGTSPTSPPPSGGKSCSLPCLPWVPSSPSLSPGLSERPRFAGRCWWGGAGPGSVLPPHWMAHRTSPSLPCFSSFRCPRAHL